MRKIIVAINVTIDGYCDHTSVIADDDLHNFYSSFLENTGISIMGRVTYQLMEQYWPDVAKNKIGNEAEIHFAEKLDEIQKIVVSKSLKNVSWNNSSILSNNVIETILQLKQEDGKQISIGGPSLISFLTKQGLIDEFILLVQPIIQGRGLKLFSDFTQNINLELLSSSKFSSGVILLHYKVTN